MLQLSAELNPFIGRDRELSELARLLTDPKCRLITLVGPGGSGKTRLAIQAANDNAAHFSDGVYFVGLQPVSSGEFLMSAIADALGYSLRGSDETAQILDYLHDKQMLLVLDNFEHLLNSVDVLDAILQHTPGVKLLVTSREVLNLREEWLYPVQGMPFPSDLSAADLEDYGAVELFVEHARRVRRDFSLDDERVQVVRLCRVVEGMPLALELAASWLKSLPCRAIVNEIEQNLDFLNTNLRNIPVRHRSMRTVFEHSWKLLTDEERQIFKRLSVFRGGFQRKAAEQVAGASLATLSTLVDKSLLHGDSSGRYQIHELLRQYAVEQLQASSEEAAHIHELHCDYFADFLDQRYDELMGSRQVEVNQEITEDMENVRAMWEYAAEHKRLDALEKSVSCYAQFCEIGGRYQESTRAMLKAVDSVEHLTGLQARRVLALAQTWLGWDYIRLGQYEDGDTAFRSSQMIYEETGLMPPLDAFGADPLNGLAMLAVTRGDFQDALEFGERAQQRASARGQKRELVVSLYALANASFGLGKYDAAYHYAWQAYELTQEVKNSWMSGYILIVLGDIERAWGNYDQALRHYQNSHDVKKQVNDAEGMAVALNHMGWIALAQQQPDQATNLFHQSLKIYQRIYDPGGLGTTLFGLSDAALMGGDYAAACSCLCQALEIATTIRWPTLTLRLLLSASDLLEVIDEPERSVELLQMVLSHPASDQEMKARAQQSLDGILASTPALSAHSQSEADLHTLALALYTDLRARELTFRSHAPAEIAIKSSPNGIDSLTDRELEVLRLMAAGLSNPQIAERLIVATGTVKAHTNNIFSKLGVSNRVQAVNRAKELNLL
jgi:predicted ATPase/DNA-binding NarL/FixJ family response regulator